MKFLILLLGIMFFSLVYYHRTIYKEYTQERQEIIKLPDSVKYENGKINEHFSLYILKEVYIKENQKDSLIIEDFYKFLTKY
jgi:hypothetical protein